MTDEQPLALRLAASLEAGHLSGLWHPTDRAAAELRRLAAVEAENEALRARIAEFVAALDEEKVVSHIGVFNEHDDPRKAIKDLMLWSQGVGEYFAKEENEALKAELAEQCRLHGLGSEREARLMARVTELERVEAAVRNLVKVKGRYHTEQAFKALAELLGNTQTSGSTSAASQSWAAPHEKTP
jgi:hypothetical protein